jgi:MFS family permease
VAGCIGGFFEAGLSSLLPLYGLAQGLSPTQSTLLVSASGLGSALMMLPAGLAADRWPVRQVGLFCARINLLGCLLLPALVMWPQLQWVSWGVAFVWGGAGGALYTLAMVHIGHRLQGEALVRTTSVLVLSYTLGSMCAPALGGMALQWAGAFGLPLLLTSVALLGLRVLSRH